MIKINVFISNKNWKRYLKAPEKYLKNKIAKLNKNQKFFKNKKIEFSLKLTGNEEIKRLNEKFRNKNTSTDILSFPFYEKKLLNSNFKKKKLFYLGDVIINLNKIKNKNDKKKLTLSLNKLWIHGLLHLLGYDHKRNENFLEMERLENRFFKSIK